MFPEQNALLRDGQAVVRQFVCQFCPEETVYLQHLWKQFSKYVQSARDRSEGYGISGRLDQLRGFCFAQSQELNLITPVVIATVVSVLQEMHLDAGVPSVERLSSAIDKLAAELGASRELAKRMKQNMAQPLHDLFQQAVPAGGRGSTSVQQEHRQVIRINVSKPTTVDEREVRLLPRQAAILLCEFVRRRRMHWTHGFVLFERWCRFPPSVPKRVFQNAVAKLVMAIKEAGGKIELRAEKRWRHNSGFWEMVVPQNVMIAGDIEEAKLLRDKSQRLLQSGQDHESAEALEQSIKMDPDSVLSFLLMAQFIRDGKGGLFRQHSLRTAWFALQSAQASLWAGLDVITEKGQENSWRGGWAIVAEIKTSLEQELRQVSEAKAIVDGFVDGKGILSEDDLELERVSSLVQRIDADRTSSALKEALAKNDTIVYVCRTACARLRRIFLPNCDSPEDAVDDLNSTMWETLWDMVCTRGKRPAHYKSLKGLTSSWVSTLAIDSAERMMESVYGISRENQRILREYETARSATKRRVDEAGDTAPGSAMVKKWDDRTIHRTKAIRVQMESLRDRVDLDAYWNLFRKPSAGHRPSTSDPTDDGGAL